MLTAFPKATTSLVGLFLVIGLNLMAYFVVKRRLNSGVRSEVDTNIS
jgi:hypothetical protein